MDFQKLDNRKSRLIANTKYWQQEKPILLAEQDLQEDKQTIKNRKKVAKKELSTTKFLMYFLFISCTVIEGFTLFVTILSILAGVYDFTALQMLITAVVGEVVAFAVYALKSLKENTKGGIVYETAMFDKEAQCYTENNTQEEQGEWNG